MIPWKREREREGERKRKREREEERKKKKIMIDFHAIFVTTVRARAGSRNNAPTYCVCARISSYTVTKFSHLYNHFRICIIVSNFVEPG